jgi:hypothetical protein
VTKIRVAMLAIFASSMYGAAFAQDTQQPPPPVPLVEGNDRITSPSGTEVQADTRPLTGAQPLTLGSALERSYFLPSLNLFQVMSTNGGGSSGQSDIEGEATVTGNVALEKLWSRSRFSMNYTGGGLLSEGGSGNSSFYQSFGVSQSFSFRRSSLSFFDVGSYVPESPFGFFGLTGVTGYQQPILNGSLLPNQSILAGQAAQWSNSLTGQMSYALSPRASLTGVAGVGLLRSSDPQFLNSTQGNFSFGFNYLVRPKDTLGVSYSSSLIGFGGSANGDTVITHSVQAAYGRRITGRLALQVSGGPQIISSSDTRTSWTSQAGLTYGLRGGSVGVSYGHYVTGGSGVLAGASTDNLGVFLSRQLSRKIAGSVSAAYGRNASLSVPSVPTAQSVFSVFNTEYLAASLSRPLGRELGMYLNYNLQHQSSTGISCGFLSCGDSITRHVVGLGINWHTRPLPLGR